MKKIVLILMMFLLCACSNEITNIESTQETDTNDMVDTSKFIEPISSEEIFSYLNKDTKDLLYKANNDEDIDTNVLKNLGKELIDANINTYDGKTINLSDYKDSKLIIEVVASWCSHCKEQALSYNEELLETLDDDITVIQYFANGDSSNIEAFYKEVGIDIPNNIIIGVNDDELSTRLVNTYNLELTPTFYFFNKGVLTFETTGTLKVDQYNLLKDVAFNDVSYSLTDSNGNDIFSYIRDEEDVKNDLSNENYTKLEKLDNDTYTISYTLKYLGMDSDFYNQLSDDSSFTSEVEFIDYIKDDLIVVFIDEIDSNYINLINEFTANNSDIKLVVLNLSDENNETIADELDAPLVSIMNQVPELFNEVEFVSYPSALFIKEGIVTGAYSNIESSAKLLEAYNLFLTDNSIALKANNQ